MTTSPYTDATPAAYARALRAAKGPYQANLLRGVEALSGATLKGKARRYSGRYLASRRHLLARLPSVGVKATERRGPHGKRILVLRCLPGAR